MDLTVATSYGQHVVISPLAIVRLERRSAEEVRRASSITLSVGGVVGPVLAAVADRVGMPSGPTRLYLRHRELPPLVEMADVTTCWAADVPEALTSLPGWPEVESFRPITFYPRRRIARLRLSRLLGLVMILDREAAPRVALPVAPWHYSRVKQALVRVGYPIEGEQG